MLGLPDVEKYLRVILRTSLSKKIRELRIIDPSIFKRLPPGFFPAAVKGRSFISGERHGEFIFCGLSDGAFVAFYFGLHSGIGFSGLRDRPRHARAAFIFNRRECLYFVGRKPLFGSIRLIGSIRDFISSKFLGPDALKVDFQRFREIFKSVSGKIRPVLMDQMNLAGITGSYADEILFRSRTNPAEKVEFLSEGRLKGIYGAMRDVFEEAIELETLPKERFIIPNRVKGGCCPRCGDRLAVTRFAGQDAFFCSLCQPVSPY